MIDKRLVKLANILTNYSLELKKNDLFVISGSEDAVPLIKEVYKQALVTGAHPHVRIYAEELDEIFYKYASEEQLKYISPLSKFEVKKISARLTILAPKNTKRLTNIDPKKQAYHRKFQQEIHQIFLNRAAKKELRWTLTQYPTNAAAQDAEMSIEEYEDFVFKAAHVYKKYPIEYWKNVSKQQEKISKMLQSKKTLHILAEDTDLKLSVEGRKWVNADGHENFPDGEIFTGPVENSVNGYIRYSYPAIYSGREVEDIRLEFKNGKVVKAKAAKGEDFLKAMLNTDAGAKRIGEFAFGNNYGIQKFTKNILFDEKIGGTIHIALGSGYPETGSKNKSGIHWDMICDLRKNSEILADGELIYKNGRFII
jgi:aminopeptidase